MSRNFHGIGAVLPSRIILWLFAVLTVIPFALLILTSLKSRADLIQGAFVLPAYPHFENYANAWIEGHFNVYFLNSVLIVFPVVIVSIILGTLMGFSFAFLSFPFRRTIFVLLTIGMMVPTEAFIIPLYYEMRYVGLINTYAALILPQIAMSLPFATMFMASAMQQLPLEVIEAAVLDGASRRYILSKVIVPLMLPSMSTLALFLFIWTWNEFLIPLVLVNDDNYRTLPIGMLFFQGRYTVNTPVLTAGAVIVIGPLILAYMLFQRKLITGLTAGATK
ncbi:MULTISPECIES: carbohydrate ABC transporter permease [Rhizobium]|uniref:Carbohydrate ABC transporter permease n=1 Tax=Rhizobium tropici TaxID=398 RepID=A0A6P1C9I3_RHITR|nr:MULTISPECIES: carbohydrate ABC transporter permease [Rhizobium]AGB75022.1 putative amino acid ABC transporter, permease protein [Rhizobium tropici CIAT 899]MBB4243034.1 raffinose/stachyose/melibiose transport system permease protein [Rhizobium tropici]MBB5594551.1 raffinose/stachyose/melibiose transport system permease protein [Rhizobium tropici]MBB6493360.1 raffinose/stachyose/melibiose transport system permease protein [Rhizobium tropici]NEV11564.1 carbohydrate ABC transporter permease [R